MIIVEHASMCSPSVFSHAGRNLGMGGGARVLPGCFVTHVGIYFGGGVISTKALAIVRQAYMNLYGGGGVTTKIEKKTHENYMKHSYTACRYRKKLAFTHSCGSEKFCFILPSIQSLN